MSAEDEDGSRAAENAEEEGGASDGEVHFSADDSAPHKEEEEDMKRQQSSQTNEAQSSQQPQLPALALRTIPGYAGHLPGYRFLAGNVRHQMDKILASILSRSSEPPVEVPAEREVVQNPQAIFMRIAPGERCRQPSTLLPGRRSRIPGYQGFVPKVRYSSAALGLRYSKAALNSLTETESQRHLAEMKGITEKGEEDDAKAD